MSCSGRVAVAWVACVLGAAAAIASGEVKVLSAVAGVDPARRSPCHPDERAVARHFSTFPAEFSRGLPRSIAPRKTAISLERLWQNCPILGLPRRARISITTEHISS